MRHPVEQYHPAILGGSLAFAGSGYVNDLEIAQAAVVGDGEGTLAGVDGEDSSGRARWIFEIRQRHEENCAKGNPAEVERPPASRNTHCAHHMESVDNVATE